MVKATLRRRLLLMVLAPMLVLGAVEAGLRIFGYRYDPFAAQASRPVRDHLSSERFYRPDPELIWTLVPSTVLDDRAEGFFDTHTNSLGLRGPELGSDEVELKVLCLGDSITFGLALEDDETYPARLTAELAAALSMPSGQIRVVNGGVPGWSTVQGRRLLAHLRSFKPDVVVFWFGVNDAKRARGVPDSQQVVRSEAVAGLNRNLGRLRLFQLMQQVLTPVVKIDPDARRATVDEFAENVRFIEREWGDRAIFIRCPQHFDQTIAEFRMMIADADRLGVSSVAGPGPLLSPWTPTFDRFELSARKVPVRGQDLVLYGPEPVDARTTVSKLRAELEQLLELKSSLDARLAMLPASALGYRELFGDEPPGEFYFDNCHLNANGAERAAAAIAGRIAARLR